MASGGVHGVARKGAAERPAPNILYLLKQVQYKAYLRLERALQPLGLTSVQYRILSTVAYRNRISSAQLARIYAVKPQTMFKQIAILETKALIRRTTRETNKRVLELDLTPSGVEALKACDAQVQALEMELLAIFTPGEQAIYRELMLRMMKSMPTAGEDARGG
jgi:DNA-binding MarR family transcriptional regulator